MNRNIKIGDTIKTYGIKHRGWIIGEVVAIEDNLYVVNAVKSDVPNAAGKTWYVLDWVPADRPNRITII